MTNTRVKCVITSPPYHDYDNEPVIFGGGDGCPSGVEALRVRRRFLNIELNASYYTVVGKNLEQEHAQATLQESIVGYIGVATAGQRGESEDVVAEPIDFRVRRRRMGAEAKEPTKDAIIVKPQYLELAELNAHLPSKAKEFLQVLDQGTYWKKGFHEQDGTTVHWCVFDLPIWARKLACKKPNVVRLREYLLELHIIQVQVDGEGQMWIGWNLKVEEWLPAPLRGGCREGAGRPQKNQNDNAGIQDDNPSLSQNHNQDDNANPIKMITSESNEGSLDEASPEPIRNVSKKLSRTPDAHASAPRPPARAATPRSRRLHDLPPAKRESTQKDVQAFRKGCFAFMRETYRHLKSREGKEIATMSRLFLARYSLEAVRDCWQATIRSPRFGPTNPMPLAIVERNIDGYIDDPVAYRAEIDKEIVADQWRQQQRERSTTNGQSQTGCSTAGRGTAPGSVVKSTAERKAAAHQGRTPTGDV